MKFAILGEKRKRVCAIRLGNASKITLSYFVVIAISSGPIEH